ncbi:DUF4828 domain-containing protein [Lacticaseibacillus sharpeae]|uniref:DUF4828 domain-containing protein n=1 Tax=Lacticaseibacillus sharpeae JCM 1186 = DSM 20505 TaxID=1291052 RepID=A0A0R1ZHE7_9LACO|nr:DUF4828 domain-containing protein [Lacticaseibacillus sharpeae]KRM54392.1 hypothetical protein FC18_GL000614 [Lacticaseibacillus sharpeae JCM 1186 = DSM 20505]
MAGKISSAFNAISHSFGRKSSVRPNPALALADLYRGDFNFIDNNTHRHHSLQVSPKLDISIDGKRLPGKIVGITTDALTFLDHYGYELIITCMDGLPTTVYDEAEDETYPIIYPELEAED